MSRRSNCLAAGVAALLGATGLTAQPAFAQAQPNIVFIMGDDIGWSNIGVYNQGHHVGPNAEPRQTCVRRHAFH
jgi:arylsulfatase